MLKFDPYYFQCPNCHAWLEGRNLRPELINESILYSDGKVLNDNYITTRQKLILCPSCGHVFWVEDPEKANITTQKPDADIYSWNTWRFYGIRFSDNRGKMALIRHYQTFLKKCYYEPKNEIYLRRLLWWAYNDLHRNHQHIRLKYFLNGFMSYGVWHNNRMMILEGEKLFLKNLNDFTDNLHRLLSLLQKHPDEAIDMELAEIYRELRQFDKAKEMIEESGSKTYFGNELIRHSKWKDPRVFMVSG